MAKAGYDDVWGDEPDWFRDESGEGGVAAEEEEDGTGPLPFLRAQHILLLIDCNVNMFSKSVDREGETQPISPVEAILQMCTSLLRQRVKTVVTEKVGKRDGFGILLYGTRPRSDFGKKNGSVDVEEEEDGPEDDDEDDKETQAEHSPDELMLLGSSQKTCHTLLPLHPPGVSAVKTVLSCCLQKHHPSGSLQQIDLQKEFADSLTKDNPPGLDVGENAASSSVAARISPLQVALQEANKVFRDAKCVKKATSKKNDPIDKKIIWIFTNQDNPCPTEEQRKLLLHTARDVKENGIQILVWPLPNQSHPHDFRHETFYDDIINYRAVTQPSSSDHDNHPLLDMEQLSDQINRHWKKITRAFYAPLLFPDWKTNVEDPGIMLDFYRCVQVNRRPPMVQIHQEKGTETEKISQLLIDDTGEILPFQSKSAANNNNDHTQHQQQQKMALSRLRYYAEFAGENIPLTPKDVALLKARSNANSDFASLILLGFKRQDCVPFTQSLEHSYFVYPNDELTRGSSKAFAHLHASMLRKKVMAIGELLTRVTATSRLVAIYAIPEELEDIPRADGRTVFQQQKSPPGMIVKTLPYEDEVRSLEPDYASNLLSETGNFHVSNDLLQATTNLVHALKMEGIEWGTDFENTNLSRFWNYIEHVALEEPLLPDQQESSIAVNEEDVLSAAGNYILELQSLLPVDIKPEVVRKRPAAAMQPDVSGVDWEFHFVHNSLSDCKVAELKQKLRSLGEKISGKKEELISRLIPHLEASSKQASTA